MTDAERRADPRSSANSEFGPVPTPTDEDRVHWTDALLGRVHPRRGGVSLRIPPLTEWKKTWARVEAGWKERRAALADLMRAQRPGHEVVARLDARLASAWELPAGAKVGIPHPLELAPEDLARWSQLFADYQLMQPFPQLGRQVYAPTDAERTARALTRAEGLQVATGKVLGLEQRRWRRGAPQQDLVSPWMKVSAWMEKALPDGRTAILDLDPGLHLAMPSEAPVQTLGSVVILEAGEFESGARGQGVPLGELDRRVFSELVRDLEGLRS